MAKWIEELKTLAEWQYAKDGMISVAELAEAAALKISWKPIFAIDNSFIANLLANEF